MSAPLEEPDVHGMRYAGTVIVDWAAWRAHPGDVALRFILDRYRQSGISVLRRLRDE